MSEHDRMSDDAVATMNLALDERGVGTALVKDGYVLMFKTWKLRDMLAKSEESGFCVLVIQDASAAAAAIAAGIAAEKNLA